MAEVHSIESGKETLRATIQFMSSHAADFSPVSYGLWFQFADGDKAISEALSPYVIEKRRMTLPEQLACHEKFIAQRHNSGQDEVMARLAAALSTVEASVEGSLKGATGLLEELEQFSASLSDDERNAMGERLDRLKASSHEVQYLLGRSASLIAGSLDDVPEFCLSAEGVAVSLPTCVVDFATILSGLHRLCDQYKGRNPGSIALIEIDRFAMIRNGLPGLGCQQLVEAVARRVAQLAGENGSVGHYEDDRILVLLENTRLHAAESTAADITDAFEDEPVSFGASQMLQVHLSIGVSEQTLDDIPEAIVGRLNRAVQRVAMRGGAGFETA